MTLRTYKRILTVKSEETSDLLSYNGMSDILIRPARAGRVGEYAIEALWSERKLADKIVSIFDQGV